MKEIKQHRLYRQHVLTFGQTKQIQSSIQKKTSCKCNELLLSYHRMAWLNLSKKYIIGVYEQIKLNINNIF